MEFALQEYQANVILVKQNPEDRMSVVKVSRKYQIVIPRKIREALSLQSGDRLLLRLENDRVVMRLRPRSLTRHLRGLHKEVWQDVDALSYVEQERASWESEA